MICMSSTRIPTHGSSQLFQVLHQALVRSTLPCGLETKSSSLVACLPMALFLVMCTCSMRSSIFGSTTLLRQEPFHPLVLGTLQWFTRIVCLSSVATVPRAATTMLPFSTPNLCHGFLRPCLAPLLPQGKTMLRPLLATRCWFLGDALILIALVTTMPTLSMWLQVNGLRWTLWVL